MLLAVHETARQIAIAFKCVYDCDGTSTRQHNEPAGNQDVWHYHLHVFPRYAGDDLYRSQRRPTIVEERLPYAARLRSYFECDKHNDPESKQQLV
jgi:histidine triad (HIT) family protein